MNRTETIKTLCNAGYALAKKFDFTEVYISHDRQKGVWGESFAESLEKEYGECTKEIKWCDRNNKENYIEFRFRFANPVLSIHTFNRNDKNSSFASLEYSDYEADWTHYDEERPLKYDKTKTEHYVDYIHTDDFRPKERQIWGEKGMEYNTLLEFAIVVEDYKKYINMSEECKEELTKEYKEMVKEKLREILENKIMEKK